MYFTDCTTPQEVKTRYKKLVWDLHPDMGGDTAEFQAMGNEYEARLKDFDGHETVGDDGKTRRYRYDEVLEREIMAIVEKLLKLNMKGVTVEIIGWYIWVYGETDPNATKPYRVQLGRKRAKSKVKGQKGEPLGLGLWWHSEKLSWYWKPEGWKSAYSRKSLKQLGEQYGSEKYTAKDDDKPKAGYNRGAKAIPA